MADAWRRVGLVLNPSAGKSADLAKIARDTLQALGVQSVSTCQYGAAVLCSWPGSMEAQTIESSGRSYTRDLVHRLSRQNLDALIVMGGDGTLADAALVLCETHCRCPIIGIGTGSTNVGHLITCCADNAAELGRFDLELWDVDCLTASVRGELLGLGFNDVVIGHTVVGTVEGQLRDLDAIQRMRGKLVPGTPRSIGGSRTRVIRTIDENETVVAEGRAVGTVVAGVSEHTFFGKAVTGGICLAALTGLGAGCIVCDVPLVQVEIKADRLLNSPPISSKYVTLAENVGIAVENVSAGAVLCMDGNPLRILNRSDRVDISMRKGAVVGIRVKKGMR